MDKIEMYRMLHVTGIALTLLGLGGIIAGAEGGARKIAAISHGVGLLVVLVAGFGLWHGQEGVEMGGWLVAKIFVWLTLGGLLLPAKKARGLAFLWIIVAAGLVAASSYLAQTKPF